MYSKHQRKQQIKNKYQDLQTYKINLVQFIDFVRKPFQIQTNKYTSCPFKTVELHLKENHFKSNNKMTYKLHQIYFIINPIKSKLPA